MELNYKQIKALIEYWRNVLQIDPQWKINFKIHKSAIDMPEGQSDAMACISVDLRYFVANIDFNTSEINEYDLHAVILHELLHIIIEPISCSSGCGLGPKFEEMNSILTESTIEKLMPGYLYLHNLLNKKNNKKNNPPKKASKQQSQSIRCRSNKTNKA